jgi:hypothetical protein
MTTNRLAKPSSAYVSKMTPREWAQLARARGYSQHAKAWDEYADQLDRERPIDGKSLAAGYDR